MCVVIGVCVCVCVCVHVFCVCVCVCLCVCVESGAILLWASGGKIYPHIVIFDVSVRVCICN